MLTTMTDPSRTGLQTQEQWTSFLSALVHELRTPLASLGMLAELLAAAPPAQLGGEERRYSENIQEVVRDLQALVGDVAELSRLLAGRVQIRSRETALQPLLDQVTAAVRTRAWEGGVALTDSLDPALPRCLRTDPERLRQALVLLLGAAVGHAKSEVYLRLDRDGEDCRAVISSDGPPFEDAALETLFQPFDDSLRTLRQRGGRSLALPLASELARALGCTLRASNRGARPTFELSIPAA